MTVSATPRVVRYNGTGSTSTYTIPFRFFSSPTSADLSVYKLVTGTSATPTLLVFGTDYTIVNNNYTGGLLTLVAGNLPTGTQLTILGTPAEQQATSLQNLQGPYLPVTVETMSDLSTMQIQAEQDQLNLAIQFPPGDVVANAVLPPAFVRSNNFLGFDSSGNVLLAAASIPGTLVSAAMIPVVSAVTLALARAAMGPWGDALVTSTLGITARSLAARAGDIVNVLDFGADKTGTSDCTAAINAAYASQANSAYGCALYFPAGVYKVLSALTFSGTGALTIYGDGMGTSQIEMSVAAGDFMTVPAAPYLHIHDIQFIGGVVRNAGTWVLTTSGQADVMIHNVIANLNGGGIWNIVSTSVFQMTGCFSITSTVVAGISTGDTCLRISQTGEAQIQANYFKSGNQSVAFNRAPVVWIGGTVGSITSMSITGNTFSGGGPRSIWAITGITSGGSSFVVTTSGTHDFLAGDFLVLRGVTPTTYNNVFRIASVTSNTITVTSTLNPGTSTVQGTAESYTACVYLTNDSFSVNESRFTGNLFEAQAYIAYGSAAVYFDGRRGTRLLEGWHLTGNYYDFGATGVLLSAKDNGSGIPTVYGVTYQGGLHENSTRDIHIEGAAGVTISGLQADGFGQIQNGQNASATGDALSAAGAVGIHIFAGSPASRGITISDCNIGMGRNWNDTSFPQTAFNYGIAIEGAGIQDLMIGSCQLFGLSGPYAILSSALSASSRWKIGNNQVVGAAYGTLANLIPSVASASSISIPFGYDQFQVTGTTAISNFLSGTVGRSVQIMFISAVTINTGGNILPGGANLSVLAGQVVTATFDGSNWFVR